MCYYVGIAADLKTIEHHYGITYRPPIQYVDSQPPLPSGMINGFGHPRLPIIKQEQEKEIIFGEWGLSTLLFR